MNMIKNYQNSAKCKIHLNLKVKRRKSNICKKKN